MQSRDVNAKTTLFYLKEDATCLFTFGDTEDLSDFVSLFSQTSWWKNLWSLALWMFSFAKKRHQWLLSGNSSLQNNSPVPSIILWVQTLLSVSFFFLLVSNRFNTIHLHDHTAKWSLKWSESEIIRLCCFPTDAFQAEFRAAGRKLNNLIIRPGFYDKCCKQSSFFPPR